MRVLVLKEFGQMCIEDRPNPEVVKGQVLVAVSAVGICGTDLHGFSGANGRRHPGQVMGHEASGFVAATGEGVSLPIGAAVTFNPVLSCGKCTQCRASREQLCRDRRVIGVDPEIVSAFAEYIVVPARNVHRLPDALPVELGALIEPMAVALHALRLTTNTPGEDLLILGGGPIGQSAVLAGRAFGSSRIIVSEIDPQRRDLCKRLGAEAIHPLASPVSSQIVSMWGKLADLTIDAVGVGSTYQDALSATQEGGMVVVIGMGAPLFDFAPYPLVTGERALIGSYCYSNRDFADAVALVGEHQDLAAALISRQITLEEAPTTIKQLANEGDVAGKVLIRFDHS